MAIEAGALHGVNFPIGPDFGGIKKRWNSLKDRFSPLEHAATPVEMAAEPFLHTTEAVYDPAHAINESVSGIVAGDIIGHRRITQEGKDWADTIGRDVLFQLQQHHGRDEISEAEFSAAMSSMYAHEKDTRLTGLKKGTPEWTAAKAELANLNRVRASACGSYVSGRLYGKNTTKESVDVVEKAPRTRMQKLGLLATATLGAALAVSRFLSPEDAQSGQYIDPNPIVRDNSVYADLAAHSIHVPFVQDLSTESVSAQMLTEKDVFPVGTIAQARLLFPNGRVVELGEVVNEAAGDYYSLASTYGTEVAPKNYEGGMVDVDYGNGTIARAVHSAGSDDGIHLKKGPAYELQQMVDRGESTKGVVS